MPFLFSALVAILHRDCDSYSQRESSVGYCMPVTTTTVTKPTSKEWPNGLSYRVLAPPLRQSEVHQCSEHRTFVNFVT